MPGLTYDCQTCPFNRLYDEVVGGGVREKRAHCEAVKKIIKDGYGVSVPCGVGGVAVLELAEPGEGDRVDVAADNAEAQVAVTRLASLAIEGGLNAT